MKRVLRAVLIGRRREREKGWGGWRIPRVADIGAVFDAAPVGGEVMARAGEIARAGDGGGHCLSVMAESNVVG